MTSSIFLAVFVGCVAWLVYTYAGYPLLLRLICLFRPAPRPPATPRDWPHLTVVIPIYNGAGVIGPALDAVLALDYPPERCQVVVVSDASTDGTDDLVAAYESRGVELVRIERRGGKTAAENAVQPWIRGDIVLNSDATIRLHPQAAARLVAAFGDASIGVASGRDVSVGTAQAHATLGESGYVDYEMWVRDLETRVGGIVGASGSLYAIRRALHAPLLPPALSRDFAAALIARERGYRAVSVPEAVCFVPRARSLRQEYGRKARTITRGLETLWYHRRLLSPRRYGLFAWMLFSHKLCRWVAPWVGLLALAVLAPLATTMVWARWSLAGAAALGALALTGWLWREDASAPHIFAIPAYLAASNVAALRAWVNAMRGELNPIWEPTRRTTA